MPWISEDREEQASPFVLAVVPNIKNGFIFCTEEKKSNLLPNFSSILYQIDERSVSSHPPVLQLVILPPDSRMSGQSHPIPQERIGGITAFSALQQ